MIEELECILHEIENISKKPDYYKDEKTVYLIIFELKKIVRCLIRNERLNLGDGK